MAFQLVEGLAEKKLIDLPQTQKSIAVFMAESIYRSGLIGVLENLGYRVFLIENLEEIEINKPDYLIIEGKTDILRVVDDCLKKIRPMATVIVINNLEYSKVEKLRSLGVSAILSTDAKTDEFVAAFSSHLLCNHILAQAVIPGMKAAGFGRIINVISTSVKQPLKGLGVSNTIRAAVGNWAKTLSLEVAAHGITVNNVLPGATATQRLSGLIEAKSAKTGTSKADLEKEMVHEIPAARFGYPEEVAAAIAFLSTPAAGYINGINIPVDGGRTGNL